MVEFIKLITILLVIPVLFRRILTFLYWIQVKEYRFDRFSIFLRSKEGKRLLDYYNWPLEIVIILLAYIQNYIIILFIFYLIYQDIRIVFDIIRRKIRKPVFTQRAFLVLSTAFIFILLSIYFAKNPFLLLLLLETSTFIGIIIGINLTSILVNRVKNNDITKAKKKLLEIKPTVIGISGSYGKTSTKEFLSAILNSKAKTVSTLKNENTEFGVARMIINKLERGTQYLVVEMGAYKKGEISAICKIVNPQIGIITGIEPQHIALFKNMKFIKQAKFELIQSLPKNGMAFFNYSNKYCRELAEKARLLSSKLKIYGYFLQDKDKSPEKTDSVSKIIKQTFQGIDFSIQINGKSEKFYTPLHGQHFIENLTGAILVSYKLGIPLKKIRRVCYNMKTLPGTMAVKKLRQKSYLIDDSYNTTPQGFKSALVYLQLFKNFRKIVITPGIIELGTNSKKIHTQIGKLLREVDNIILTNNEFEQDIATGLGEDRIKLKMIADNEKQVKQIKEFLGHKKSVLLIEGRIPKNVQDILDKN